MAAEKNYHEFTELPAWTQAQWSDDKTHLINTTDPYKWSGDNPPPAIGENLKFYVNGIGRGTVLRYFAEYGWLGMIVQLDSPPDWYRKQHGDKPAHCFGIDTKPRKV
jgi:hypothetical protein